MALTYDQKDSYQPPTCIPEVPTSGNPYEAPSQGGPSTYAYGAQPGKAPARGTTKAAPGTAKGAPVQYVVLNADGRLNANRRQPAADTFDHQHFTKRKGKFTFDLCTCCERGSGFCCEALCCYYCNLARQCNMCCNNEFGGTACCCSCFWVGLADVICTGTLGVLLCCGGPVSWLTNCCTRSKTRLRFGIEGGCCCDCWAAICCAWCVVQQSLGEFYVQGFDHPTSCCYDSYPTPQIEALDMA